MDQVAISHPGEVVDYSRALAALPRAQRILSLIRGAHTVGVGTKITKGQHSTEPALMVFVRQKRPLTEIEPSQVIPRTIEGVPTDVIQAGPPTRLSGPDNSNYKTIRGGIQIEPGFLTEGRSTDTAGAFPRVIPGYGIGELGTIGFFVNVNNPQPSVHAVTNWHVVGAPMRGTPENITPKHTVGHTWQIDADPSKAITPNTLLVVELMVVEGSTQTRLAALHRTADPEPVSAAVSALVTAVSSVGHGVAATPTGQTTIQLAATSPTILALSQISAFGPPYVSPSSKLTATITDTTISFAGKANEASAAFITVNVLPATSPAPAVWRSSRRTCHSRSLLRKSPRLFRDLA
jgi:hypothetical protein